MSGLAVRRATGEDVGAVADLADRRPFTARWSIAALTEETSRPGSLFLVATDGPVKGYAIARLEEGEVRLLDLAAAFDGEGVGRALWDAVLDGARSSRAAKLTLEVSASNSRALDFYSKAGAAVVGRRPKFYDDGSDAVLMDLQIP